MYTTHCSQLYTFPLITVKMSIATNETQRERAQSRKNTSPHKNSTPLALGKKKAAAARTQPSTLSSPPSYIRTLCASRSTRASHLGGAPLLIREGSGYILSLSLAPACAYTSVKSARVYTQRSVGYDALSREMSFEPPPSTPDCKHFRRRLVRARGSRKREYAEAKLHAREMLRGCRATLQGRLDFCVWGCYGAIIGVLGLRVMENMLAVVVVLTVPLTIHNS